MLLCRGWCCVRPTIVKNAGQKRFPTYHFSGLAQPAMWRVQSLFWPKRTLPPALSLKLTVAKRDEFPEPGHIYIAPGGSHLRLNGLHRFEFSANPTNVPHIPSGDSLLESVARSYGSHSVGVVLTGMGDDGANGLRFMYDVGAMTIAQDEATSVVFGMPREAIARGAARQVLPLSNIARELNRIARPRG